MKRQLSAIVLISGLMLLLYGCGEKQAGTKATSKGDAASVSDSLTIELDGRDGSTVLELTLESHQVEYYESAMGAFVKAIDSVKSGDSYWWLFTVNDSTVNAASDKYETRAGDRIVWHFKKP